MPVAFSSKPCRIPLPQLLTCTPRYVMKLGCCQCCFLQSDEKKKRYKCADYEIQKAPHRHKDVFPVTLSFMQKSDLQTGHLSEDRSFAWNLEYWKKNVFVSVWCVLECCVNLFTLRTLFGKVDTHLYLIDYELHVLDMNVFFSLPFLSHFCYQTDYKKENSIEVWTIDVYTTENNFFV